MNIVWAALVVAATTIAVGAMRFVRRRAQLAVAQQIPTAQILPSEVGADLTGELVCSAREVIHGECDRVEDGSLGEAINPWGAASVIVLAYVLGFADSSERWWVQAMFMGSVIAVIVIMLLLLRILDDPFHGGVGGLQPAAMERTTSGP